MSQTIEDLHNLWSEESKLDINNLGEESVRTRSMHGRYYGFLIDSQRAELKAQQNLKKIAKARRAYYLGQLSNEQLKKMQWEPYPFTVLRADVGDLVESDEYYQQAETTFKECQMRTRFIESCLSELRSRDFTIKNALEWQKLIMGA